MRTTLTLEDDVFQIVRTISRERDISLGTAVSEMIRRGLTAVGSKKKSVSGFPTFELSANGKPITMEDVQRGEDEP